MWRRVGGHCWKRSPDQYNCRTEYQNEESGERALLETWQCAHEALPAYVADLDTLCTRIGVKRVPLDFPPPKTP